MSSLFHKHNNNNTLVAQPYTQQQLLVAQQQGLVGSPLLAQPVFGTQQVFTEQQLVGQQQQFIQQRSALQVNEPATTTTLQPIVQQSIRQDRVVEVQPIIHRDIERPVVNHIERHITEPAPLSRGGAVQHGAIVEERVHNRIVNEIQPVIHREIAVPQVEQVQQHFVERVVATPQHTRQVVYEQIPAIQGQQFIQQGLGTQQYLQTGLVQRSALLATQQPGFLGTQQFIGTQQPLLTQGLVGQQQLIGTGINTYGTGLNSYGTTYGTGLVGQRALVSEPLVGGYGTGLYGAQPYGLTKAEQKEEKQFERNLNRQQKRIEKEQNQIQRHQLRQFEQVQNEQSLLARHQLYQQQQLNRGLVGSPLLATGPAFGSQRAIYTADPLYSQQYISSPIYGTGLQGQQFYQEPIYGTGLQGQQFVNNQFGTGLQGQQFLNNQQGLQGQQFLNNQQGLQGQQFNNQQGLQGQQFNNQGLNGQQNLAAAEQQALNREVEQQEINNNAATQL